MGYEETVVKPKKRVRRKYRLRDLLARVPADCVPAEENWGKPVVREAR